MTVTSRIARTLATWFGCGLVPRAPGTMGTLGAIPLYLLVAQGGRPAVVVAAVVVTLVGVWASSVVARDLGKKDPQLVVIDEVAGLLVTMIPVPTVTWQAVVAGFVLFRALDMLKPWPIRAFERLPGGWGIVMDDVAAGVVGAGLLAGLRYARVLP
jgi:phosphatidylglycerophosphatase A